MNCSRLSVVVGGTVYRRVCTVSTSPAILSGAAPVAPAGSTSAAVAVSLHKSYRPGPSFIPSRIFHHSTATGKFKLVVHKDRGFSLR